MVQRATQADQPLDGRTALVTGASSGIGEATARVLAADGANVTLAARREERLDEIAESIRAESDAGVAVAPTNVRDSAAVAAAVERTVERFGGLDIAVCNAGVAVASAVTEMTDEEYERLAEVNMHGMFYTAREAIPHLQASGGNLVFLGSMSGNHPRPAAPVYAATKWWTRGLAASLQAAYGEDDIAVTCVNPTEVRTEFGAGGETAAQRHEPGSVTEPVEVADAIAYAVRQRPPNAVTSLDLYRRDKLTHF